MLQTQGLKTLDDLRGFLAGSQGVEIHTPNREAAYGWIAQALSRSATPDWARVTKG